MIPSDFFHECRIPGPYPTARAAARLAAIVLAGALTGAENASAQTPISMIPSDVRVYTAEKIITPLIIDGRPDEEVWSLVPWSESFIDIRGANHPDQPHLRTRMKILWDTHNLYVAAELEEPHLWATLTERDAIIYRDHDFEIFLDPDGDGEAYYEYEVNALGTVFDLFLDRPYSQGGSATIDWDIPMLQSAVHLRGTLNDPSDMDEGWTIEVAIPWIDIIPPNTWEGWRDVGMEPGPTIPNHIAGPHKPPRERIVPRHGDIWRMNFSRVHWPLEIVDGGYVKTEEWDFGEDHPEWNWVWSPQGEINMHLPSRWGAVRFRDGQAGGDR